MNFWKIIQILKAARLLLVIILLLIVLAGKFARADEARLYGARTFDDNAPLEFSHETPKAACAAIGGEVAFPDRNKSQSVCYSAGGRPPALGVFSSKLVSCEAKDLTNPNPFGGDERLSDLFILRAPPGIDAADWYSDKFNSCENNCLVINSRFTNDKVSRSVTEADGSSRSVFTKRQTGAVCVTEKRKPNEPPKPPKPADDKPDDGKSDGKQPDDGKSGSGAGSDNGNGQGNGQSSGGSGSGTDSGSDNPPDPDNGKNGAGGGSGGGSGGSSGGGGQIAPDGGGTNGGQNGQGKTDGSQDGTDGQGNGQSGNGSESGNGSGEGSDQTGGDGAVDGDPDGKGEGDGKGDGKGSISGGSCDADQAPSCKGDPIQCYIAVEQWRTACAASGQNSSVSGGNCENGSPPECKGDAAQCYIAEQEWRQSCAAEAAQEAAEGLEEYGKGQTASAESFLDGSGFEGMGDGAKDNDTVVNIPSQLDTSGFGWSRACPVLRYDINTQFFGTFSIDFSLLCGLANFIGHLFVAVSLVLSARYILR